MPLAELGVGSRCGAPGAHPRSPRCAVKPSRSHEGGAWMMESEKLGASGSGSSTGTAGPRSRSKSRARRLQLLARLIVSDPTLRVGGFPISATSLVRRSGDKVVGCTCTPCFAACSEKVSTGHRLTRVEVHAPWCRGRRLGAGGSSGSDARNSSDSTAQAELLLTSASTSPRDTANMTRGG